MSGSSVAKTALLLLSLLPPVDEHATSGMSKFPTVEDSAVVVAGRLTGDGLTAGDEAGEREEEEENEEGEEEENGGMLGIEC